MSKRTKNIILLVAGIQVLAIIGFLALPSMVQALPGRYRVALAERSPFLSNIVEGVVDQVAPVATALPAPSAATSGQEQVDIAALLQVPTLSATAVLPTETPTPQATAVADEPTPTTEPPTATPEPTLTPTAVPLPQSVILEGMGVIRQTFNNCGPANLTQVLNWYGSDITQTDVAAYLKPTSEDRNVSPWQIVDFVNEQMGGEFKAEEFSGGTLDLLKQLVAADFPVVIEKGYELPSDGWYGHYLTVFGYNDAEEILYSQDTFLGPWDGSGRTDDYTEFLGYWEQFNYTFYVVYRPEDEANLHTILGEELLDEFSMWRNVAAQAEQSTQENPEYEFAWFNLGSALTRLGELTGDQNYYQAAAQAYDRAREIGLPPRMLWYQFRPYFAYMRVGRFQDVIDLADATLATQGGRNVEETYWYKGLALAESGESVAARDAFVAALEVNPNFYPAQISLDWVNSLLNG